MVNDERIIIHSATLRPTTHTIPLKSIRAVNRKRNELILTVIGQPQPVVLRDVAHSRRVQEEMSAAMARIPRAKNRPATFKLVCSIGSEPTNAYNACARAAGRMWAPMPSHP